MINFLLLFGLFSATSVFARHPDVKLIKIDGQAYEARPIDAVKYCPPRDVVYTIHVESDRNVCIKTLATQTTWPSADQLKTCYRAASLVRLFDQLQLMGVKKSCLTERANWCAEIYDSNGNYYSYLELLRNYGWDKFFTTKDSKEVCDSLIYPD